MLAKTIAEIMIHYECTMMAKHPKFQGGERL